MEALDLETTPSTISFEDIKSAKNDDAEIHLTLGDLKSLLQDIGVNIKEKQHSRKQCSSLSLYKENGIKKASAAEPFRTPQDFAAIADYLASNGSNRLRNYMLIVVGTTLGMRVGDLMRIRIGDVLDEHGKLRDYLEIIEEKTGKRSKNMFTPKAKAAIMDYLNSLDDYDMEDPLFCSRNTNCGEKRALDKTQVWRILNGAARACDLKEHIGTHSMRKTYGYSGNAAMLKAGLSADEVMEVLQIKFRHSSQTATKRYLCLDQQSVDAVSQAVDNWLE